MMKMKTHDFHKERNIWSSVLLSKFNVFEWKYYLVSKYLFELSPVGKNIIYEKFYS